MHSPTVENFQQVKRILCFVSGTLDFGIRILQNSSLDLFAFSDSDWAGCQLPRRSTTGFCMFLGSNCISWSAKKQPTVARSSTKVEYRTMASTAAELTWLAFLLLDVGVPQPRPATLFCDNIGALHLTMNPVFHARTKHIEIDYHLVREKVALGLLVTKFVPSHRQLVDLFTSLLISSPSRYPKRSSLACAPNWACLQSPRSVCRRVLSKEITAQQQLMLC